MSKFIIIRSIFKPTRAIYEFANKKEWHVVVVGDRKTPKTWSAKGVTYLSIERQEELFPSFRLPENSYARKMFGYLYAIKAGATIIAESDDDNIPYDDWGSDNDIFQRNGRFTVEGKNYYWVNVYSYFSRIRPLWPRGFPLDLIHHEVCDNELVKASKSNIAVVQQLADGDPDVDAIYRLVRNDSVTFRKDREGLILSGRSICPINSQNTFFRSDVFALMYLPVFVNFRVTDILRGYIISVVCNYLGMEVAYDTASVFQERNEHDYLKDFQSEIPLYEDIKGLPDLLEDIISQAHTGVVPSIADLMRTVYNGLLRHDWVKPEEMVLLDRWLDFFKSNDD